MSLEDHPRVSLKTLRIIEALQREPKPLFTEVAAEFGLSRERIRQIAAKAGIRSPQGRNMLRRICPRCHKRKAKMSRLCQNCFYGLETVPCASCGKFVRLTQERLRVREERKGHPEYPQYTGQHFCNRVCFFRWVGNTKAKGSPLPAEGRLAGGGAGEGAVTLRD